VQANGNCWEFLKVAREFLRKALDADDEQADNEIKKDTDETNRPHSAS
jgi:hypothetical protein